MRNPAAHFVLFMVMAAILVGCAGSKKEMQTFRFRFVGARTSRSDATVMSKKEACTTIEFLCEPQGTSVYAYDNAGKKRGRLLGKTPFKREVMIYKITEYSDMTAEYEVDVRVEHQISGEIDYSDPESKSGEITFSFVFDKAGFEPKIERIAIPATNEMLIRALVGYPMPEYKLNVSLERRQ